MNASGALPKNVTTAIEQNTELLFRRQSNKDAVVRVALEDLRDNNDQSQAKAAPAEEKISEDFLDRFERSAEDASTDELRARFGKILAAEIRRPGTVSRKAIRVVDELDAKTARLFERFCQHRLSHACVPKCLSGELPYPEMRRLVDAELLVDPSPGQTRLFKLETTLEGSEVWFFPISDTASISIPKDAPGPSGPRTLGSTYPMILGSQKIPAVPCYALTEAGLTLASVFPHDEAAIITRFSQNWQPRSHHRGHLVHWPGQCSTVGSNRRGPA